MTKPPRGTSALMLPCGKWGVEMGEYPKEAVEAVARALWARGATRDETWSCERETLKQYLISQAIALLDKIAPMLNAQTKAHNLHLLAKGGADAWTISNLYGSVRSLEAGKASAVAAAVEKERERCAKALDALYLDALAASDADLGSDAKSHRATAYGIGAAAIRAFP